MMLTATGSHGRSRGCERRVTFKRPRAEGRQAEASSREYEEESDTETFDWSNVVEEAGKGKGKASMPIRKKKGARSPPRDSTGKPVVREWASTVEHERRTKQMTEAEAIHMKRHEAFANRTCIGERFVNFGELTREVPEFGPLLEKVPIEPVGGFQPRTGYCSELIRAFYLKARVLEEDHDTENFEFVTSVRGVKVSVTPETVGAALGLNVDTSGLHYTNGRIQHSTHWNSIVNAICKQGTRTNHLYIESKDLKPEYHILSLIVCYNILPTMGTKRIRWDRLVLLYLLGHPERAEGLNINIPFLIWQRMTHIIQTSTHRELLPYPHLIMLILENHGVDTTCNTYKYSLGPLDAVTLTKSISILKNLQQFKAYTEVTSSAPSCLIERKLSSGLGNHQENITLESLHRDVCSLKKGLSSLTKKVEEHFKKFEDGFEKLFDFLGC